MRLWARLAVVMAIVAVLPLIVAGGDAIRTATRQVEGASQEQLQQQVSAQSELVGRWVLDQVRALETKPVLFGDALSGFDPASQQSFARLVYLDTPAAVTVVLVDGAGAPVVEPVYQTRGARPASSPERARTLLERLPVSRAASDPGAVAIGEPWLDGQVPSIPLAILAAAGSGRPEDQRILGVEIQLEIGTELLSQITPTRAVAIVDASGRAVLGGDHELLGSGVLKALGGLAPTVDFGGRQVLGRVAAIPHTPGWSLVMAESAEIVLRPAERLRVRLVVSVLIAACGALALALAMASSLSRPVEQLRNTVLRVADGGYGDRLNLQRTDEIGELARAVDHMSVRLKEDQEEIARQRERIEGFNRELQETVTERTRQLEKAQDDLVRSSQLAAVAEMGAGLAHDLNNPLTSVLGIAQLLRERSPDDPLLADLESQAQRCREVVGSMLRVAELPVDRDNAPVVEIRDVLERVAELVTGAFHQRGVRLQLLPGTDGPRVRADPSQCARLLVQVLAGLRAGLDEGASIEVEAASEGSLVHIELRTSRPVAERPERRDDWMVSGHTLWAARQQAAALGGELRDAPGGTTWRLVLPGA